MTEFQHYVDIFIIFKVVKILHYIRMAESFMDFDLINQLNKKKIITLSRDLFDFRLLLLITLVATRSLVPMG